MSGTKPAGTLPPEYFEQIYAARDDPWNFTTSAYEQLKYADTMDHLPRSRYVSGLEVGCSIGVLTTQLATRCEYLLSVDVSERALEQARARCAGLPQVRFERLRIPEDELPGRFDLIVVSEVAYYWGRPDLNRAMNFFASHQATGAHLLLVHWTEPVHDYPLTGDEVHSAWIERPEWHVLDDVSREQYRLSVLERR